MDDNHLVILVPTPEHVAELKEKGIDLEVELTRLVCDNLKLVQDGKHPKRVGINVTKEQLDALQTYGINGPEACAMEVKKEMHDILTNKKLDN